MATTVKASCPIHGVQELSITDIHLTVYTLGTGSYYEFTCRHCGDDRVCKPADEAVIAALRGGNVRETTIEVPLEWVEHDSGQPPITWDDVLDLKNTLRENPNFFDELLLA